MFIPFTQTAANAVVAHTDADQPNHQQANAAPQQRPTAPGIPQALVGVPARVGRMVRSTPFAFATVVTGGAALGGVVYATLAQLIDRKDPSMDIVKGSLLAIGSVLATGGALRLKRIERNQRQAQNACPPTAPSTPTPMVASELPELPV
jgi:hypothetical protein